MGVIKKSNLHIHLGKRKNRRRDVVITSNNIFFKNRELVYDVSFNKIIFRVPNLEDRKKIVTVFETEFHTFKTAIVTDYDIEFGDYLIDEESISEDEITIYFNDL